MPIFLAFSVQTAIADVSDLHAYYSAYKQYIAQKYPELDQNGYEEAVRVFCDMWGY